MDRAVPRRAQDRHIARIDAKAPQAGAVAAVGIVAGRPAGAGGAQDRATRAGARVGFSPIAGEICGPASRRTAAGLCLAGPLWHKVAT